MFQTNRLVLLCLLFLLKSNLYSIDSFSKKNDIKSRLYNGAISEHISSTIYKKNGYSQLNAEVGRNGIDGLFVRRDANGKIKNVIFSEVKHGSAKLKTIKNGSIMQASREWQIIKIDEKLKNLKKIPNDNVKKQIKELREIKQLVVMNSNKIKSHITTVTPKGAGKFKISINNLEENEIGKVTKGKISKHTFQNEIIDINAKHYKPNSDKAKLQKILKYSIRKEKKLLKETLELKKMQKNLSGYKKDLKKFNNYKLAIKKQESLIQKIKKSRPNIFKKTISGTGKKINKVTHSLKASVPTVYIKKGKKVLAFMDAKIFKKTSKLKFLKNVKGGDVVMMAIESGVVVYSILHGGVTYKKVSTLLLDSTKTVARKGFSKGLVMLTPPPATAIVIATIAGEILIDYAIDKYVELEKRKYVGLEDMLWDVPDEIKNKITMINLEDTKRETVFDFEDIDKEIVFDSEQARVTILENDSDKKTILDY